MTGDFIDAETAQQRSLVNRVVAGVGYGRACELADRIRAKSGAAVATGKATFYKQLEMGISDAYDYTADVMACNMMNADAAEGLIRSCKSASRSGGTNGS